MPQPNIQNMLKQAQEAMAAQQEAQEALKEQKVEASAGGGMVKVVVSGDLRLESLTIDPDAVDPEDVEMLQDLVLADATARLVGQVEADLARADLLLDLADRVSQSAGILGIGAKDVKGQPLCRALPDAGQLAQLGDQALDGRREQLAVLLRRCAPRRAVHARGTARKTRRATAAEAAERVAQAEPLQRLHRVEAAGAGRPL